GLGARGPRRARTVGEDRRHRGAGHAGERVDPLARCRARRGALAGRPGRPDGHGTLGRGDRDAGHPGVRTDRGWRLDPAVTFLNHGSYGACPEPVLAVQRELRDRLEAEPVRFLTGELPGRLDAARGAV